MTDPAQSGGSGEGTPPTSVSGVLVVDKPAGWTSHDVVAKVRRITGVRRVGHAGTLDPAATGVLVLCLGAATRLVQYLEGLRKTYEATVLFGVETDTWDSSGTIVSQRDAGALKLTELQGILPRYTGDIMQVPPMYSALKRQGTPLYRLARRGEEVERDPRPVTISSMDVLRWDQQRLSLRIVCSKGTYIRSLAHDIGQDAGTGACLEVLRRTAIGHFTLEQAHTLEELEQHGAWLGLLQSSAQALAHLPRRSLSEEEVAELRYGRPVSLAGVEGTELLCAVDSAGRLVALVGRDQRTGMWRPEKVFGL